MVTAWKSSYYALYGRHVACVTIQSFVSTLEEYGDLGVCVLKMAARSMKSLLMKLPGMDRLSQRMGQRLGPKALLGGAKKKHSRRHKRSSRVRRHKK